MTGPEGRTGACLRQPPEIYLGRGSIAALPAAAGRYGRRVLICTDPGLAGSAQLADAKRRLESRGLEPEVTADAPAELPLEAVRATIEAARAARPDVIVGFGGGTCLDMAKLVSLGLSHPGPLESYYGEQLVPGPCLPVVGVPTTSGTGSEVTPVAVLSDPGRQLKVGVSSTELIPRAAICDPDLTVGAPRPVTAFAGIDALVHAVEARTARRRPRDWEHQDEEVFQGGNRASDMFAERAIALIAGSFETVLADGGDGAARADMQEGALLAGLAFAQAGTTGAHALQYPIGARTGTPHGLGVGLLAPFVLGQVKAEAAAPLAAVARALGLGDELPDPVEAAIAELRRLALAAGVPPSLEAIGLSRDELPDLARQGATVERLLRNSPAPLEVEDLTAILERAWSGQPNW